MPNKKTGELKLCDICLAPTYKTKTELELNRYGAFYCSRECFKVGVANRNLANQLASEWL